MIVVEQAGWFTIESSRDTNGTWFCANDYGSPYEANDSYLHKDGTWRQSAHPGGWFEDKQEILDLLEQQGISAYEVKPADMKCRYREELKERRRLQAGIVAAKHLMNSLLTMLQFNDTPVRDAVDEWMKQYKDLAIPPSLADKCLEPFGVLKEASDGSTDQDV